MPDLVKVSGVLIDTAFQDKWPDGNPRQYPRCLLIIQQGQGLFTNKVYVECSQDQFRAEAINRGTTVEYFCLSSPYHSKKGSLGTNYTLVEDK